MPLMEWSRSYNVGHAQFDEDHEHQLVVINYLYAAVRCGQNPLIISGALEELWDHSERHFHAEETYMKAIAYPYPEAHKSEHLSLLLQIVNLKERYEHGETHLGTDLVQLLLNTLTHIDESDRRCAQYETLRTLEQPA